jgi:hypothetical protein
MFAAARFDAPMRDQKWVLGEVVNRGLDPRIHRLRNKRLFKMDLPGQARQ